jgi:hypothetical protein
MLYRYTFIFLCIANFALGQGRVSRHSSDNIEWNEFYKLQWSDFEGKRTDESIGDAGTAVQIKAKPFYSGKQIEYDVYAYFNRSKSWSTDRSNDLLAHEQLHFDLAELYARKIRKKIKELRNSGVNVVEIYNAHIKKLLDESNEADLKYDMETLHGAMAKRQAVWKKKITEELDDLDAYKRAKRVIHVSNKS